MAIQQFIPRPRVLTAANPKSDDSTSAPHPWQMPSAESHITPEMTFNEAAEIWMRSRGFDAAGMNGRRIAKYVQPNTERSYRQYIGSLKLFFGEMSLNRITLDHLGKYQTARVAGEEPFIRRRRPHEEPGPCPAKAAKVNQELRLLIRIKKRAHSWSADDTEFFEEMQEEESEVPRALTEEEQCHWLDVSRRKERWNVVHWYSLLAFDTCMSTNEERGLRLGDVNLRQQVITVPWPASKNRFRHRTIAIESADALWACERLLSRAHELGSREARDYLFPFRDIRRNSYLPDRHMTVHGIRALWVEVREAANMKGFRPYDTRHTAITRLAEQGVPIEVIKSRGGHFSDRMSRHYTQISLAAQRKWTRLAAPQYRYAPPAQQVPATQDVLMNPAIQAEIARQVALALQGPR